MSDGMQQGAGWTMSFDSDTAVMYIQKALECKGSGMGFRLRTRRLAVWIHNNDVSCVDRMWHGERMARVHDMQFLISLYMRSATRFCQLLRDHMCRVRDSSRALLLSSPTTVYRCFDEGLLPTVNLVLLVLTKRWQGTRERVLMTYYMLRAASCMAPCGTSSDLISSYQPIQRSEK